VCSWSVESRYTPYLFGLIPRTFQSEDYVSYDAKFRADKVSAVSEFRMDESFCDRFLFVYDIPVS